MATDADQRRKLTPRELLDLREQSWAPRLRRVSLVAEANIDPRHSDQVATALATRYRKLADPGLRGARFLLRWPACVAAAMSGAAATQDLDGTFWPSFWQVARHLEGPADQEAWGEAFAGALTRLGLPTFAELPWGRLGPIQMHAGIPDRCLPDYFRLLLARRRQDPGLDAESFLSWAGEPGRELRLSSLAGPARRFLTHGGDYALDVVDRTLDMLSRLAGQPGERGQGGVDGAGLPARLVERARQEACRGELDLAAAAPARADGREGWQARPRIALDPYGQGVVVALPAVGEAPEGVAAWRVAADGEPATVRSQAPGKGPAEAAPKTVYPLARPVRGVRIALAGWEHELDLQVVETSDPLLCFADDGRRLPTALPLPPEPVWMLHPADRDLAPVGQARVIAEAAAPFGWAGWRLRLVSLEAATAVALAGGPARPVRGQARARLLLADPVPGVTTRYGSPVYAAAPLIALPGAAEPALGWRVEVARPAGGPPLVSRAVEGPGEVDVWDELPRPLIGAFDITVRGPLGRGLRRTVFLAEGLKARYQPPVRPLIGAGLKPGGAQLGAAIGAAASPDRLRLAAHQRALVAEYRAAGRSEPIVVTPPHVSVVCAGVAGSTWSAVPLNLDAEAFAEAGRLLVRSPGQAGPADLEVWVGGERVQSIEPSGPRSAGTAAYDLARAADTVAAHGRAELMAAFDGQPMPVAFVRPRRLASGLRLADGRLLLSDYAPVDGLTAGVYQVFAPWRAPELLPVGPAGEVDLPERLRGAGPLRVRLAVDDPWTAGGWPEWPGADSFACPAPGVPEGGEADEDALSRFLAGAADLPARLGRLDLLWRVLHISGDLVEAGARPDLAERCAAGLRAAPGEALRSLADADLDPAACVVALVRAGLTALRPEPPADLDAATRLWAVAPAAAAVACSRLLPLAGPEEAAIAKLAEEAVARCGESLRRVLGGHGDDLAGVGGFGPEAESMAAMSKEQVDALWQAAAVVPAALLDADTRAAAARRLFDARRAPVVKRAARDATALLRRCERLIAQSGYGVLGGHVAARQHPGGKGGWLVLPALSAALALVARIAARGDGGCQELARQCRELWADLAQQAPDLVGVDLVLAEALVAGVERGAAAREGQP